MKFQVTRTFHHEGRQLLKGDIVDLPSNRRTQMMVQQRHLIPQDTSAEVSIPATIEELRAPPSRQRKPRTEAPTGPSQPVEE